MKLKCEKCNKQFVSPGGFSVHIKRCLLTKDVRQKIRDLYLSGMLISSIIKLGFKRCTINLCINDIKRSLSQTSKIAHKNQNRKKTTLKPKKYECICEKCGRDCKNPGALARHKQTCHFKKDDNSKILALYKAGVSLRQIVSMGYSNYLVNSIIDKNTKRNVSEALKFSYKLHPERIRKWTEQEKQKASIKRKQWLESNKNKHNWRYKSETYPEKIFREWLKSEDLEFIAEYTPDNFDRFFRIDFAFPTIKLAIELNGNQHYNPDGSFKKHHLERQHYIEEKGWRVLNIRSFLVIKKFEEIKKLVLFYVR
jgi:very-short-patch-repair endonuclease